MALQLTGDPVPVVEGLREVIAISNFALAGNGTLYFVAGRDTLTREKSLVWLDRAGKIEPVTSLQRAFFMPRLSPSGKAIATTVWEGIRHDVWLYELETQTFRRLTSEGASFGPLWSPNGDRIAYTFRPRDAKQEIRVVPVDGRGEPRIVVVAAEQRVGVDAEAWTADGRTLLYSENRASTDYDVWSIAIDESSDPAVVAGTEFYNSESALSPDGRWISFSSERTGQSEVFVQPFPEPGPARQISQGGGSQPRWLPGELIYVVSRNRLVSVPIQTRPALVIGRATTLLAPDVLLDFGGFRQYDPTGDGQRFLAVRGEDPATPNELAVIVYFSEELQRLAAPPARGTR